MGTLYENIIDLCHNAGVKPGRLCSELGLSRGLITDLKMGRKKSINAETAAKIADYFQISVSQLLGREDVSRPGVEEGQDQHPGEDTAITPTLEDERDIANPDIRMIARAGQKMTPQQAENLRKYAQFMFPEAFKDDT